MMNNRGSYRMTIHTGGGIGRAHSGAVDTIGRRTGLTRPATLSGGVTQLTLSSMHLIYDICYRATGVMTGVTICRSPLETGIVMTANALKTKRVQMTAGAVKIFTPNMCIQTCRKGRIGHGETGCSGMTHLTDAGSGRTISNKAAIRIE